MISLSGHLTSVSLQIAVNAQPPRNTYKHKRTHTRAPIPYAFVFAYIFMN